MVSGSLLGGAAFQLSDPFFHLFAGLERHHKLFWDKDFLACARIPGLAGSPLLDLEDTKIAEFDSPIFNKGVDDGIEGFLNDFLSLQLGETNLLRNGLYDLFLRHDEVPLIDKDRCWDGRGNNPFSMQLARSKCNCHKH